MSKEAAALMSGRKPTSSTWRRKSWFSMPYTRSRNNTMGDLWSGTKLADILGSMTLPSRVGRADYKSEEMEVGVVTIERRERQTFQGVRVKWCQAQNVEGQAELGK